MAGAAVDKVDKVGPASSMGVTPAMASQAADEQVEVAANTAAVAARLVGLAAAASRT